MQQIIHYGQGQALAFADYGDQHGFPVLVQHGMVASIDDGDLFERLIQAGRRVICAARPGYGQSSPYALRRIAEWAEVVAALVAALGLSRFDVLGLSSGAPYSYALGYRFPEQVRNLFIFSGIPALYDAEVLAHWPYAVSRNASLAELETLARALFFANVPAEAVPPNHVRDAMMNHCFGPALDLQIRMLDWGFRLEAVLAPVFMQHSQLDDAVPYLTAERTAQLLPHCVLHSSASGVHFSKEALDEFIRTVMLENPAA